MGEYQCLTTFCPALFFSFLLCLSKLLLYHETKDVKRLSFNRYWSK